MCHCYKKMNHEVLGDFFLFVLAFLRVIQAYFNLLSTDFSIGAYGLAELFFSTTRLR